MIVDRSLCATIARLYGGRGAKTTPNHIRFMILSTQNSIHLTKKIAKKKGESLLKYTVKQFADGEYYYRLDYKTKPESVDLIGNVTADPYSLFELMALARAAYDNRIRIKRLIIPFLGYGRQDRLIKKGEAIMARLVAEGVNRIRCSGRIFVELHSDFVRQMLEPHREIQALGYLAGKIKTRHDIIVSPDRGASERAELVAGGRKTIVMPKIRPKANMVSRKPKKYPVKNTAILIVDDMIDTGRTVASAADILKEQGASSIDILAAHGILSRPSRSLMANKNVDNIYVSNTLPVKAKGKIRVISIADLL